MGPDLQDLYKRGGGAWALKYYKEQVLSALTDDLEEKASGGIKKAVCNMIKSSLKDSIAAVKGIEDGNFLSMHFYEKISRFLDMYSEWNEATTKAQRVKLLTALRDFKSQMFEDFYKHMNNLMSEGEAETRMNLYMEILEMEQKHNAPLSHAFKKVVDQYGDDFVNLKRALHTFNKRL